MTKTLHMATSGTLPHYWPVNGVAVLADIMKKMGIDAVTLLAGSGIHPQDLGNSDIFITPEQELLVLKKMLKLAKDPKIGFIIGQQHHVGVHVKLGAAVLCSDTALDAMRLAFKYSSLVPSYFQHDLSIKDDLAFLKMKELLNLKDIRVLACEANFVAIYRMCGDVLGTPFTLHEIGFAYPRPSYASAYQDIFRCPVHFDAHEHIMVFDSKFLSRKLPMSNTMASKTYEKECEQLYIRQKALETVTGQMRHRIMTQSEGLPSFSQLARSMNLSVSTLRRYLNKEGTSFKNLMAEILSEKAIDMIQTTSYPMEHIAMELGYSDMANFYRAFKGWTGKNPGDYRKNH
ncbi:MAG TPA: AraC family transcriptional regulator [Smithella sp.]|nr:AraC family transcriptional regulator [Smithella sp.]